MRDLKTIAFILGLCVAFASAQGFYKQTFRLAEEEDNPPSDRLHGYGIVDLVVKDSLLWAATGYALNKTADAGEHWQIFKEKDYIGKGGVSAIGYMDESTLWIATAYDTTIRDEVLTAGGGLSYSRDGGKSWNHLPQPIDPRDVTEYSPTTTNVQNITYDIGFVDSTIWIASFGGGLRRSDDLGQTWKVVTTDGIPFSSLQYLNHRAFSLLNENDNLWVGTAQGISKSSDNGKTWERFTAQNQEQPISGNFVVAFGYQDYNRTVWAATIEATDTSEVRAVSKTSNSGQTWEIVLEGIFAHNFAFDGAKVYVAADEGMFISEDNGQNWYEVPPIKSYSNGKEFILQKFYSAAVQEFRNGTNLWLGTSQGLTVTNDNGNTWKIIPAYVNESSKIKEKVYAYPSPFPTEEQEEPFCHFKNRISQSPIKDIKIFDFSLNLVRDIPIDDSGLEPKWDGKTQEGHEAASGVYFFRAEVDGEVHWGKIVFVKK